MLVQFRVAGNIPLAEPPEAWVERVKQLAAHTTPAAAVRKLLATLAFDSWALPEPVGVRGSASIEQRRVRFEADPVVVDLRGERRRSGWSFVAQVSGVVHEGAEFKADTHTLLLDEYGICQWSDEKPPTKLAVVTKSVTVELPGLTWKAKLPKRPRKNS